MDTAFDESTEVLQLFSTAQERFKTIYLQRELTRFSQLIVCFGVPALLAAAFIVLLYGGLGGVAIDPGYLPHVTSLLVTVVFVPLVLLTTFILRTAKVGPTLPQKNPDEGPFAVSYDEEQ